MQTSLFSANVEDVNTEYFQIIKAKDTGFSIEAVNYLFQYFLNYSNWTQDSYVFSGKTVTPRRKTAMFGKNYNYSGQTKIAAPYGVLLTSVSKSLEELSGLKIGDLNGCLANLYEDGRASISYHQDDETDMDLNAPIVVLSLGADRQFQFKNIETSEVTTLTISNGDILIMKPGCQEKFLHGIPKEKNVKNTRISLTFRKFV